MPKQVHSSLCVSLTSVISQAYRPRPEKPTFSIANDADELPLRTYMPSSSMTQSGEWASGSSSNWALTHMSRIDRAPPPAALGASRKPSTTTAPCASGDCVVSDADRSMPCTRQGRPRSMTTALASRSVVTRLNKTFMRPSATSASTSSPSASSDASASRPVTVGWPASDTTAGSAAEARVWPSSETSRDRKASKSSSSGRS
mmetsp:Transcript_3904/g.14491  ORF Transcript_3904/g.14491 Transcript_3904/m.14491 type:complete len:202 (-) Transcript_3904:3320-3925(-)